MLEAFMMTVAARPALSDMTLAALRRLPCVFTALLSDC